MSDFGAATATRLNDLLLQAGQEPLLSAAADRFAAYCTLLLRWNARTNLTAIRDEEGVLSRHFVECIATARSLPSGITTLLDFGSGAGFPGIPIALCRPEIAVTLAESQGKKAAFLREAIRTLGLNTVVHSQRAETLSTCFDCATLRAVDQMQTAVKTAAKLVFPGGLLAVMTTAAELASLQAAVPTEVDWQAPIGIIGSQQGILALGRKLI